MKIFIKTYSFEGTMKIWILLLSLLAYQLHLTAEIPKTATCDPATKTVLVIGGAGLIGSHVNKLLNEHGYKTIVLDNLSTGKINAIVTGNFIEGDVADRMLLDNIFKNHHIDVVMHFAASINVAESCRNPAKYYLNNVCNTLNLLQAMIENGVGLMVFSSTAAIFAPSDNKLIPEEHPCLPISPYGRSKLMVEEILADFDQAYPFKYCSLRYFNAVGGDPAGKIKNYKSNESNLMSVALRSLKYEDREITIFGRDYPTPDGTCIRDYIHVYDLAYAHILAMEYLLEGNNSNHFNLGSGKGFSVLEIISAIEKVTRLQFNIIDGDRRPGDPVCVVADIEKARIILGWNPVFNLEEIIIHAWNALP